MLNLKNDIVAKDTYICKTIVHILLPIMFSIDCIALKLVITIGT